MQTWLITGANRGIGLALTRLAAAAGHRIIATCRDPDAASELGALADEHDVDVRPLDVADASACHALADALDIDVLDVLVNNAGVMPERQSVDDMDEDAWLRAFAINAIAPWRLAVAFAPRLSAADNPRVATLTSQMGSLERAAADRVAYRSSKAAANMAMRTLAIEWRERGITVCMLHPGWVRTDMGGSEAALGVEDSAGAMLRVIDGLSLADSGRFVGPDGQDLPW